MAGALTDFAKGIIAGFIFAVIIFCIVAGLVYSHNRDKGLIEYAEKQMEILELREDVINRGTSEIIDTVPGVSGAIDGAAAEFIRKRDEALQRLRGGSSY